MISISYAITVCDEYEEIKRLLDILHENISEQDEIVVLFDQRKGTEEVLNFLKTEEEVKGLVLITDTFQDHFAEWKNKLTKYCSKDYIFQIDADEYPGYSLLKLLPEVLKNNDSDIYAISRINTVEGLTEDHIKRWGWRVNNEGHVNFPDYQWRLYKNNGEISWRNKVHEVLEGHKTYAKLPASKAYCLYHPKKIDRQERQNSYYSTLND